jgi:type I restriction enzyme S subunit
MSKEIKIIPELRFPEFMNEGKWNQKTIKKFIKERNEISNGEYPLFSLTIENGITPKTERYERAFLVKDEKNAYKLVYTNDFAFNPMNLRFGAIAQFKGGLTVALSKYYNIFYCDESVGSRFCEIYFKSKQMLTIYDDIATGSLIEKRRVHFSEFLKLTIPFPKKEEQQKIASCLSSLDELIVAHNDKLDALKDHKKGLMQNLFPEEGETVPKVRFKEFKDDGKWELKELGKVAEIITGNTPSTKEPSFYGGEKMFVSPADINDNRIVSQTKTTLTELGFSKTRQIKSNSVLFVCIGSTIGKIAQNKYECATNQQINSLVALNGYSSDFLYSLLDSNSKEIASIAGKHAVPLINKTSFSAVKLPFPPRKEEQQKIAYCLLAVDELITAQADNIEQLQQHKKGMMQGLFPKIER